MNDAEAITFAWLAFGIALGVWLLIYFLDSWIEVKSEKKKLPGGGEGGGTAVAGGIAALPVAVERPALPKKVRIVEVGPRDGLQNEAQPLDVAAKVRLIEGLVAAGIRYVEAGSFVSPKWVPQMAGSAEVFAAIERVPGVTYAALTPNLRGFERAMEAGVAEVAVFAAASEAFSERNINCSIAASLERFAPVMAAAGARGVRVRGYVSCVLGCPYEGAVAPRRVLEVSSR
ncbi:MAG: hydroxymethylglutaryl-CoA lyase, partial [Cellvibrionales bacterium]|nr:hydroxymethylglutaryl-CoA lyase [Cellvibrionales bacterium]